MYLDEIIETISRFNKKEFYPATLTITRDKTKKMSQKKKPIYNSLE
jgi:hypothetical protein